ncbi:putative quinol monooxygenase [Pseudomonas fragi]|uniref:putative quinol monooxygenase n=1 Tax=Pseudomonas fragi TaxID=296 RepID=UPI002003BA52|nr:antibiotic biosynthesis monooxygenase [Pseudomonas fragi]MCK6254079.1 antibiotic biosynthesis monooxygenase [Pseudomonas fragi]
MFIEGVSTIHIQAAPDHHYELGVRLENIIEDFGAHPDCASYFVSRCTIDLDVWVVSSHWTTYAAMERHFTDPSLGRFMDLLASRAVRRIEFNSFFNKHSGHAVSLIGREAL